VEQQELETTNAAGVRKGFRFPANLPSANTARRSVLIATPGFAALGLVAPDYTIPARFVPTDAASSSLRAASTRSSCALRATG